MRRPSANPNAKYIGELHDIHKDDCAFVIGNGLSVQNYDTTKMKNRGVLIGCNLGFKIHPLDYVVWQDTGILVECSQAPCIKICSDKYKNRVNMRLDSTFFIKYGSNKMPHSIGKSHTGGLALNMAILMGCNPIILVGCDCCIYPSNGKHGLRSNIFKDKVNYSVRGMLKNVGKNITSKHLQSFAITFESIANRYAGDRDIYKMGEFGIVNIPSIEFKEFWSDKHP